MLKFLRRYRALILAVGGSLLMVAFLLSSVIPRMGQGGLSNPAVATVSLDGSTKKIRHMDWLTASREIEFFKNFMGTGQDRTVIDALLNPKDLPEDDPRAVRLMGPEHWLLLKIESEQAGFKGAASDGRSVLAAMAVSSASEFDNDEAKAMTWIEEQFQRAASQAELSPSEGYEALAEYRAVRRLLESHTAAGIASERRQQDLADRMGRRAMCKVVSVDAGKFTDDIADADEETMTAHFEKFRDTEAGRGENGLGYRHGDRIKFEYIQVEYDTIASKVKVTGLDAREWYMKNRHRIPPQPGSNEPPAFELVSRQAMTMCRDEMIEAECQKIAQFVKAKMLQNLHSLERDGDYRTLPPDWAERRMSFEKLRQEIADEFAVDVAYTAIADRWIEAANVEAEFNPGIGPTFRPLGGRNLRFPEIVDSIRELGHPSFPGIQVGLEDPEPTRNAHSYVGILGRREVVPEDLFYCRFLEAEPAGPAESLDEVRAQVVKDLKRMKAFERLSAEAGTWRQRAIDEGMEALATSLDETPARQMVTRLDLSTLRSAGDAMPPMIEGAGRSEALADAVLEMAARIPADMSAKDAPVADRTIAVPVPETLNLVVVQIETCSPVSRELYEYFMMGGLSMQNQPQPLDAIERILELNGDFGSPFSMQALKKQYGYIDLRPTLEAPESETPTKAPKGEEAKRSEAGSRG